MGPIIGERFMGLWRVAIGFVSMCLHMRWSTPMLKSNDHRKRTQVTKLSLEGCRIESVLPLTRLSIQQMCHLGSIHWFGYPMARHCSQFSQRHQKQYRHHIMIKCFHDYPTVNESLVSIISSSMKCFKHATVGATALHQVCSHWGKIESPVLPGHGIRWSSLMPEFSNYSR